MKWSYSMNGVMRRCQRQFGYSYVVASHASDGRRRDAFILKQLQTLPAWRGHLIHEVLATQLRDDIASGRGIDVDRLTAAAMGLAERQFAFSSQRRYREPGQSKSLAGDAYCALFEHEYDRPLPVDVLEGVALRARECFERLIAQRALIAMLGSGTDFESEVSLAAHFDGVALSATIDLAFRTAQGRLAILDWKIAASETSEYAQQLLVYGVIAARSRHWPETKLDDIDLYEVNLIRGTVRTVELTDESLTEAEDFIFRSTVQARELVVAASDIDLSGLDLAQSPNSCAYCNFGRLCAADLRTEGRSEQADVVQAHLWV